MFLMPAYSVWVPPMDFYNGVNNRDVKDDIQGTPVEIRADGSASLCNYVTVQTVCQVDVGESLQY